MTREVFIGYVISAALGILGAIAVSYLAFGERIKALETRISNMDKLEDKLEETVKKIQEIDKDLAVINQKIPQAVANNNSTTTKVSPEYATSTSTEARITSLGNNSHVNWKTSITGEYKNLNGDGELWLYVRPPFDTTFYLQEINELNKETWGIETEIGENSTDDRGARFEVGVYLANKELSNRIRARNGQVTTLNLGGKVLHLIHVIRR